MIAVERMDEDGEFLFAWAEFCSMHSMPAAVVLWIDRFLLKTECFLRQGIQGKTKRPPRRVNSI